MSAAQGTAEPLAAETWTCARCQVTVRWMAGHERREHPATWIEEGGCLYCLTCQRSLAAEAGAANAPADTSTEARAKLRTVALVEFEIRRNPERSNGEIARAIRTSVPAVLKARRRLEAESSL